MKTLINLIGEQPIPNLLPILHFKPDCSYILFTKKTQKVALRLKTIIPNVKLVQVDPYSISSLFNKLNTIYNKNSDFIFNVTGGTKLMSIALFQFALEKNSTAVYLESQNNKNRLIYLLDGNDTIVEKVVELKDNIELEAYLNVHLDGYEINSEQDLTLFGIKYENEIVRVLKENNFEILQSVKPLGEGNQLEIDAFFKKSGTNNFAIAEIKSGSYSEAPKKGIDQLSTAGSREYLGTYTKKFLISNKRINNSLKKMGNKHGIVIIDEVLVDKDCFIKPISENKLLNILNKNLS